MPIQKYIKVEPAELNRLNIAYGQALRMLDIVDRFDPLAENVAKEVVDARTSGVTDPWEIAQIAVGHFRKTLSWTLRAKREPWRTHRRHESAAKSRPASLVPRIGLASLTHLSPGLFRDEPGLFHC
jgi:hypothetical protein